MQQLKSLVHCPSVEAKIGKDMKTHLCWEKGKSALRAAGRVKTEATVVQCLSWKATSIIRRDYESHCMGGTLCSGRITFKQVQSLLVCGYGFAPVNPMSQSCFNIQVASSSGQQRHQ